MNCSTVQDGFASLVWLNCQPRQYYFSLLVKCRAGLQGDEQACQIPSTRFEPSLGWFQTCCCLWFVHESWASASDSIFISLRAGKDWTASDALLGFESNPHSSTLDIADSSFSNLVFECKKISLHRTIVVKYKYFENEENETFLDWQLWSEYFSNPDFAWQEGQLLIGLSRKPWLSWSCGSS